MNTYKLSNSIKRDLLNQDRWIHYDSIKKQRFSFAFLNALFSRYCAYYASLTYCCKGEDFNCCDEGYCSDEYHIGNDEILKCNKHMYDSVKKDMNRFFSHKKIGKRHVFVAANERYITVMIPMRDVTYYDILVEFDKTKPIN